MAKVTKMVKPLVFTNKETGEKVTIEFNRSTILAMDRDGVDITEVMQHPLSGWALIFYYGMKLHHPDITMEEAEHIALDEIGMDDEVVKRVSELFMAPYNSIMEARKNSVWTMA